MSDRRWRATLADGTVVDAYDVEVYPASGVMALWLSDTRMPTFEQAREMSARDLMTFKPRAPDILYSSLEWRKVEKVKGDVAARRCPCEFVEIGDACSDSCSCRNPLLSGGCSCCASYGSRDQQVEAAKHIADWLLR